MTSLSLLSFWFRSRAQRRAWFSQVKICQVATDQTSPHWAACSNFIKKFYSFKLNEYIYIYNFITKQTGLVQIRKRQGQNPYPLDVWFSINLTDLISSEIKFYSLFSTFPKPNTGEFLNIFYRRFRAINISEIKHIINDIYIYIWYIWWSNLRQT